MSKIDRLLNSYQDPYGDLYLYLRDKLMKGMLFKFNINFDQSGLFVIKKDKTKQYLPTITSLVEICVDFVTNEHSPSDYMTLKNRLNKSDTSLFSSFKPKYKDFSRHDCYKPVILLNKDLLQIEVKSKNVVLYKSPTPKFQIFSKDLIDNSPKFKESDVSVLLKSKEIEIFLKIDSLIGDVNTSDNLQKPEIFFHQMFLKFINTSFLELSDELFNERLKIFGLEGYSIKQIVDQNIEPLNFKDCLKMELLINYSKSKENNAKVLKELSDKYDVMVNKMNNHLKYYQQNEVVKEFEWDF